MSRVHLMSDVAERLGWLLVHSIWQFAFIALAALLLERAMQRVSAKIRYCVLLGAFGTMLAAPIATWLVLPHETSREQASLGEIPGLKSQTSEDFPGDVRTRATIYQPSLAKSHGELVATDAPPTASINLPTDESEQGSQPTFTPSTYSLETWSSWIHYKLRPWLATLAIAWCVGVLAFSLRPILSWYTIRRLRLVGVSPVPDALVQLLRRTAVRLRISGAVSLLQSTLVQLPCVVGYFRPVILLPISLVSGLSPAELEAILAHELAHIRRHDYLVNLLQTLVETVFFYHPAIWWLSHRVRCERENCCDDMAVAVLGCRVEYGRALLALEQKRGTVTALAVGASGGSLLARVRRLFGSEPSHRLLGGGSVVGLSLLAVIAIVVGIWIVSGSETSAANNGVASAVENDDAEASASAKIDKVTVEAGRAIVKGKIDKAHDLVVRIDRDEKPLEWRSSGRGGGFEVVVEASDKIRLDGGKLGHGFVVTTKQGTASNVSYVDCAGDLAGRFTIRREADFVTKDGVLTFADITLKNGKQLSVALHLAPSRTTTPVAADDAEDKAVPAAQGKPRLDRLGDPLPAGAIARLGSVRPVDSPVRDVTSVVISSDGLTAATLTRSEGLVRLWETATGKQSGEIQGHSFYSMAMAPGKSPRLAVQVHERLAIYDIAGKMLQGKHGGMAEKLAFADGGRLLFGAYSDGTIRVWDVAGDKLLHHLAGHPTRSGLGLFALSPSADGNLLASSGWTEPDLRIKLWDVKNGREHPLFQNKKILGKCLALSPDGGILAVDSASASYVPDGRILAEDDHSDAVHFWDTTTGRELRRSADRKGAVSALAFAPDGRTLAEGRTDGTVRLLETATGGEQRILSGHRAQVTSLAWSADGRILISACYDSTALVWDATGLFPEEKKPKYMGTAHVWEAGSLAASPTKLPKEPEKGRTIKRMAMFLIDAKTKGVSEPTETKGTGIKQIEITEGTVAKKVLPGAKDSNGDEINEYLGFLGREWVVKSVKMTLADDTVVEAEILLGKETGKATLQNVKKAGPRVVSDNGTRTWNAFYAENQVATDASQEDIAQAEKDMEALQGTWRENKMQKVVVKGDRLSRIDSRPGQEETITGLITIDPKTKAIDWPMETGLGGGTTMRGIYELKGDNLRIIFFGAPTPRRPKTFDEKNGWLLVLNREKPNSPPKLPKEGEEPPAKKTPPEQDNDAEDKAAEDEAVEAITKLGGTIARDEKAAGNPVIGVNLDTKLVTTVGLKELASLKDLRTLSLHMAPVTDVGLKELAGIKSLQTLVLRSTKVTDAGLKELRGIQSLQSLDLSDTRITDAGLTELKELGRLKSLNIRNTKVTDAGMTVLAEIKSLESVNLWGTEVTDVGLNELKELKSLLAPDAVGTGGKGAGFSLKEIQTTESLTFIDAPIKRPDQFTNAWLKQMKAFAKLRALNFDSIGVTEVGLAELKELQSLQSLNLHRCYRVTDAALKQLKDFQSLQSLDLSFTGYQADTAGNPGTLSEPILVQLVFRQGLGIPRRDSKGVTDAGLKELKEIKNLQTLNLEGTQVTDAGLAELKDFKSLQTLHIGLYTKVTAAGLLKLKDVKSLKELGVGYTPGGPREAALKALQEASPELRIKNTGV